MNTTSIAWVPNKKDNYLTKAGVKAVGGRIIESDLTVRYAEHGAFVLSQETSLASGHYIVVYS